MFCYESCCETMETTDWGCYETRKSCYWLLESVVTFLSLETVVLLLLLLSFTVVETIVLLLLLLSFTVVTCY